MKGNTAIANILKLENTDYLFCYPANLLIEEAFMTKAVHIESNHTSPCFISDRKILAGTKSGMPPSTWPDGYSRINNGRN